MYDKTQKVWISASNYGLTPYISKSSDRKTWTATQNTTIPTKKLEHYMHSVYAVATNNNGIWVAVGEFDTYDPNTGNNYNAVYSNDNGTTWNPGLGQVLMRANLAVVWTGQMFMSVGSGGTTQGGDGRCVSMSSKDGITWIAQIHSNDESLNECTDVVWNNNKNIGLICGTYGNLYTAVAWANYNSDESKIDWNRVTLPNCNVIKVACNTDGSVWVGIGSGQYGRPDTIIRTDSPANTWTSINTYLDQGYSLIWNGSCFIATGIKTSSAVIIWSYDGVTWNDITTNFPNLFRSLTTMHVLGTSFNDD